MVGRHPPVDKLGVGSVDLVRESWIEDRQSRYVVIRCILEAKLLQDGLATLKWNVVEGV